MLTTGDFKMKSIDCETRNTQEPKTVGTVLFVTLSDCFIQERESNPGG